MPELRVNPDHLIDFIAALLEELAGPEARAALWFNRPIVLPITADPIDSASPFAGSGSKLAGEGIVVQLTQENAQTLAAYFAQDTDALSALVHLEVESVGQLQFRSYDSFEIIIPGPVLDSLWLDGLIESGIVDPQ